jgi:hypothetical protein
VRGHLRALHVQLNLCGNFRCRNSSERQRLHDVALAMQQLHAQQQQQQQQQQERDSAHDQALAAVQQQLAEQQSSAAAAAAASSSEAAALQAQVAVLQQRASAAAREAVRLALPSLSFCNTLANVRSCVHRCCVTYRGRWR